MLPIEGIKVTDVTLEVAKEYLKIDYEDDDQMISTLIVSAKSFIQSYLNRKFSEFEELPDEFTIACLSLVSHWYENRVIHADKDTKVSELKYMFSGLLDMHRAWSAGGADLNEPW